jgi:hypothetical protein
MNQIRLACRACTLAGLAAAVLVLGPAPAPAASATAASCAPTVSQLAALPPSPCVPVLNRLPVA